jgi:hypothetical protein
MTPIGAPRGTTKNDYKSVLRDAPSGLREAQGLEGAARLPERAHHARMQRSIDCDLEHGVASFLTP